MPGALLNALAVCMCQEVGEPPALALEDIAALSAKFQSKYEALEPKRASDEQLLRRAAASGQSQDLQDLRREAAAIYRQGQRAILLEALEEMRTMTDQVGA